MSILRLPHRLTRAYRAFLADEVARSNIQAVGEYEVACNGRLIEVVKNIVPTEGLNAILDVFTADLSVPSCYITLHANTVTPLITHNAATYNTVFAEITSGSQGYSESTRVLWDTAVAASGQKDNYSTPAVFTIIASSTLTVAGVAMLTASAKGATTGKAISIVKFAATRDFENTDLLSVKYRLTLAN